MTPFWQYLAVALAFVVAANALADVDFVATLVSLVAGVLFVVRGCLEGSP